MSSHFLTDKSLHLESRFGGWALAGRRVFAEPGVDPHYTPDRSCRILHIALDLAIDPVARTLVGYAYIRLQPVPGGPSRWQLDLDEVTVDAVEDPSGAPLVWRHADGKLDVPVAEVLIVRWHGRPRRGLYFVGPTASAPTRAPEAWTQCQDEDAHFIFPCFDHPSVKHPFTVRLRVPEGYGALSNGRLVMLDGTTSDWEQVEPMPAYLFTAVVMKLTAVHDDAGGVPLRYVVPAGVDEAVVRRVFAKTPAMVTFLASRYGAYPWPRYDQVVVHEFIFGGMENIAATTLTDVVLTDERAALDFDSDSLIVHELAHQWFGDLVTCQDWSQGWLNEGWATYTEHLWFTEDRGEDEAAYLLYEQLVNYMTEESSRYRRPIVSYLFRAPIDVFDRHLYEKGALVLHTLRTTLGEEAFWAGVREYLHRHRYSTVHTRHFQRALEDVSGRCLDRFFDQWIHGAGHPVVEVEVSHDKGLLTVAVKQTQEGEGVAKAFHFPLELAFGANRVTLQVEERERTYTFPCPVSPAFVEVDSRFRLLVDLSVKAPRSWLITSLRSDPGVVGRIRAAAALAREGSPEAIEALAAALVEDRSWGVRAEVADRLGERGGQRETAALIGATSDPHPKVRRRVVAALGGVRREEVGPRLLAMAGEPDASLQVEGEVAKSLGRLRVAGAREVCERLLDQESWSEVLRARALEGLGALRDPAVLATVVAQTADHRAPRVRAAAAAALGRLADELEELRTPVVERLGQLAEDPNFRVQVAALNALGVVRDARALATLERVHTSAPDGRCRRLAWEAMVNTREGRTTPEGLAGLRRDLDLLVEENRRLRDRVGRLEPRS